MSWRISPPGYTWHHHPVHFALRRTRRVAGHVHHKQRARSRIDDRNYFADRHRQKERHHDGRFCSGRRTKRRPRSGRIDLLSVLCPVPAHHDDNDGCDVWLVAAGDRNGRGQPATQASRDCDRRRLDRFADAHALYHTGNLFVARSDSVALESKAAGRAIGYPVNPMPPAVA